MGDLVELRPDPAEHAHAERVRFACWLIERPDLAEGIIRRGVPVAAAFDELCIATGRLDWNRRHMRRLTGPAGTRRRPLPKNFGVYRDPR